MAYTSVFGGNTIKPSDVSYNALTISVDTSLVWPSVGASPEASAIVEVTATTTSLKLKMPSVLSVSPGESVTIRNVGANTFTVTDMSSNSIVTIAAGQAHTIYVRSNATANGTWGSWQAGAGSASTDPATLDGSGLEASDGELRVAFRGEEVSMSFDLVADDRAKVFNWTGGNGTITLPLSSDPDMADGWFTFIKNNGDGELQLAMELADVSSTLDGLAPADATISLSIGMGLMVMFDGAAYTSIISGSSPDQTDFSYTSVSVSGSGDRVLSDAEQVYAAIRFTGVLTGNRLIEFSDTPRSFIITNATSGAYTLKIISESGANQVEIEQGKSAVVYCNGAEFYYANNNDEVTDPLPVANGGTGASTSSAALDNLGAGATGKALFATANAGAARTAISAAATGSIAASGLTAGANTIVGRITTSGAVQEFDFTTDLEVATNRFRLAAFTGVIAKAAGALATSFAAAAFASAAQLFASSDTTLAINVDTLGALWEKGSNVAGGTTVSLGNGGAFAITGNSFTCTTINFTAASTDGRGAWLRFTQSGGILGTSGNLDLPGGVNIGIKAGDRAYVWLDGSTMRVHYFPASGTTVSGWQWIEDLEASGSADLTTSDLSAFRALKFVITGVRPANDLAGLRMRLGTSASIFVASLYTGVRWIDEGVTPASALTTAPTDGAITGTGGGDGVGNQTTDGPVQGEVNVYNFNATRDQYINSEVMYGNGSGVPRSVRTRTLQQSETAKTHVRFEFDSGNISAGTISVFGLK